jgi:hypothetical protein
MITWILNYLASQSGAKPLSLMTKVDQLEGVIVAWAQSKEV